MRYVIYGAGAIGGVIGARLHQSGRDVALIARGAHLDALLGRGLAFTSPAGTEALPIPAFGSPADVGLRDGDVIVLAMKAQDTAPALDALVAAGARDIPIVCAQNGVENERLALRCFPSVYGMMVILPAAHLEPGVVEVSIGPLAGTFVLGRFPTGVDATAEATARDLAAAGFAIRTDPGVMRWKYAKLLSNLGNIADAAFKDQDTRPLTAAMAAEARACYEAAGVDVATPEEMRDVRAPIFGQEQSLPRSGSSTWQSVARGRPSLETDYLNGEIVLLGRLHGVPTPVNDRMVDIARELVRPGARPGSFDASACARDLGLDVSA